MVQEMVGRTNSRAPAMEGYRWTVRQMSVHGIDVASVNRAIRTAYAGEVAGSVYENERRFDLVVRFQ